MASKPAVVHRTGIQLYRDCLRLSNHIGGKSAKAAAIRRVIRGEFEKSKNETDPIEIENLKANAIRGLSNYLVFASSGKDEELKKACESSTETFNQTTSGN